MHAIIDIYIAGLCTSTSSASAAWKAYTVPEEGQTERAAELSGRVRERGRECVRERDRGVQGDRVSKGEREREMGMGAVLNMNCHF